MDAPPPAPALAPPLLSDEVRHAGIEALAYRQQRPYPHAVIDGFFDPAVARALAAAFPPLDDSWTSYTHFNERKFARTKRETFPDAIGAAIDALNGGPFVRWLERLTGIAGLLPDPALEGGGMHQSGRGDFLNVHADFTGHPHRPTWRRRVNLLVYLNEAWQEDYGGHLELWDREMQACRRKILPVFNRAVVFDTDADSFHGHPIPTTCPPGTTRKSLALYYYTDERAPFRVRSTEYRARPGDGARGLLVFADKMALRLYDKAKRRLRLSDDFAGRVLRALSRRHKRE